MSNPSLNLRVVSSGNETQRNHRVDFMTCPECHSIHPPENWAEAYRTLILNPRFPKRSAVAVMSECLTCHIESWVHVPMDTFRYSRANYPKAWVDRVEKQQALVRLSALREWGAALCHKCKNLQSGEVRDGTWRTCHIGFGPARNECEDFQALK